MLEPLKKTRLYEEIVKQILDLIKEGTLKPGDKLPPERKLAEDLHVSRTAIREALRSLEMMGYIESNVGGGTHIKSISLENVMDPFSAMLSQDEQLLRDLIDVRLLLETETAALSAKRITPEKVEMIQNAIDQMEKEIAAGENGVNGDNAFHEALAIASDNSAICIILDMCGELLARTRKATLNISGQPKKSLIDHKEIFNAIKKQDSKAASKAMREHLSKALQNIDSGKPKE
ncbi:MAG: FadR/GntR family transcriptional regulator [Eubacteriales bacterium]|nr:FadR/GntR family transcriptional regulator [Eubacteriales bacterium]